MTNEHDEAGEPIDASFSDVPYDGNATEAPAEFADPKHAEPIKGGTERRQEFRELPCKLNDAERVELVNQLSEHYESLAEVEIEMKIASNDFKSKLKGLESEIREKSRLVRTGIEYRKVGCDVVLDYEMGSVNVVRSDTDEVVESKAMTDEQRQQRLDL